MSIETSESNVETHWAGLDVSKDAFDVGFVRHGHHFTPAALREVPVKRFARTRQGVGAFLDWLDAHVVDDDADVRVCMEATGSYSSELAVWLLEERPALQPAIVNPRHTSAFIKSMGLRNKTDRLDARALAFFGAERRPEPYEPLTPELAELRDLSRYRDALVRQKVTETNRTHQPRVSPAVKRLQDKRLRLLEADIDRVEVAMKKLVNDNPELQRDIELLTSIYGVAFITAATVLAELGDLRRFHRARQLTAYAGVSPRISQSGSTVDKRPRMCKQGNARVRQALYLPAVTAIRGRSDLRDTYEKILAEGKPPSVGIGAVMRKILTIMRAILITEKPYTPRHKNCGKLSLEPA